MNNSYYQYNPNDMNQQTFNNQLTNLETGFVRGNVFDKLYDPWGQGVNYLTAPTTQRAADLRKIQELGFAMTDLNLYLDTNPTDQQMIQTYNNLGMQLDKTVNAYEQKYGPLTLTSPVLQKYPWAWISGPWPWEKEAN